MKPKCGNCRYFELRNPGGYIGKCHQPDKRSVHTTTKGKSCSNFKTINVYVIPYGDKTKVVTLHWKNGRWRPILGEKKILSGENFSSIDKATKEYINAVKKKLLTEENQLVITIQGGNT